MPKDLFTVFALSQPDTSNRHVLSTFSIQCMLNCMHALFHFTELKTKFLHNDLNFLYLFLGWSFSSFHSEKKYFCN